MTTKGQNPVSKLGLKDVARIGASGPRAGKTRTTLSALGISIGIATLLGVLGQSESSRSALLDEISALGSNVLTVEAGGGGGTPELPNTALAAAVRIPTVTPASAVWDVDADVALTTFGSGDNPMLASFRSELLKFRAGAVAVAALSALVAIFGFVWKWILRGLNAQLEHLHDHETCGPQPVSKEPR